MICEPSSPTMVRYAGSPGLASKPPPLTPYRGGPPHGGGGLAGTNAVLPQAAAAAVAVGGSTAVGGGGGRYHPPPPLWDQAMEQEKRLRTELRKKGFWDPDVRRLRAALHGTYEALIFGHYDFACAHEVEPNLWKAVFYKVIEEFRSRTRALETLVKGSASVSPVGGAGAVNAVAASPPVQVASPDEARAQLARTTGAYLRFLDEALAFYRKTVWKLQWVHGSVGAVVDLDAALQNEIQDCVPRATGPRPPEVRHSVHRCLIYLGDLCRYQSMALKERPTSARPLWERAMLYYRQAARVLPASGNPYNQMAVMSYYTSDELRAVYYYFRSLAVAMPFVTARENLLLLFEKNRNRYGTIAAVHASAALLGGHEADTRAAAGHIADVSVRFVRLHGILFDKINMHQFPEVLAAAMNDLEMLLGHPGCRTLLQKAPEADQILFHLAIMNIFSVHNITASGPISGMDVGYGYGTNVSYAAAAKRAEMLCHALAVAMRFAAVVTSMTANMAGAAAAAGGVGGVDTGFGAVSAACHVMLAWMVSNPEVLSPKLPPSTAPGSRLTGYTGSTAFAAGNASNEPPAEMAAEVTARSSFLLAAARLATHLSELTRRRAHDQDWQDPAVRHRSLPEDSELVEFGPLLPVVSVSATWPAASEAPGGAAVLAVRVARMLQALRHLDDALGPGQQRAASTAGTSPLASPWQAPAASGVVPPPGSALTQELTLAVRGFRIAVAQATGAPQTGSKVPGGSLAVTAGSGHGHMQVHGPGHGPMAAGADTAGGSSGEQHQKHNGLQDRLYHHRDVQLYVHPPPQQQKLNQNHEYNFQERNAGPGRVKTANGNGPVGDNDEGGAWLVANSTRRLVGPTSSASKPQQLQRPSSSPQGSAPPPLLWMPNGGGADPTAMAPPTASLEAQRMTSATPSRSPTAHQDLLALAVATTVISASVGGAGKEDRGPGGENEAAEDEIVYQPRRPGSALPRPMSISNNLHRRSSSGGGAGPGGGGGSNCSGGVTHSHEARGFLSKQLSGSSHAPPSLLASGEASREGSTALMRSPSALSTTEQITYSSGLAAAVVAAAAAPLPPLPGGLSLHLNNVGAPACGGRPSSSGMASPGSAQGGDTLPPSPQQQQQLLPILPAMPPHQNFQPNPSSQPQQYQHPTAGWGDDYRSSGSGGGGGGGSFGQGIVPAQAGGQVTFARPSSPAVGDLPGAGSIGLLQNLLHGGGERGGGATTMLVAASTLGCRRMSASAAIASAGGLLGTTAAGLFTAGTDVGAAGGGVASRPGSSGSNAVRRPPSAGANGWVEGGVGPGQRVGAGFAGLSAPRTYTHPPQVLQLDHSPPQPQQLLFLHSPDAPMTTSAPFAGLPVSLQQRTQQRQQLGYNPHQYQKQQYVPQQQAQSGTSATSALLMLMGGDQVQRPTAVAASNGLGLGPGPGPGHGLPGHLALPPGSFPLRHAPLPFDGLATGGGANGSAGNATFAAMPVPVGARQLPGGAVVAAAAGPKNSAAGSAGVCGQLVWPAGGITGPSAGCSGMDMSSFFAVAAGNYQAAALAEATAEATAVAMAAELLQAMDEGPSIHKSGGGVSGFPAYSGVHGGGNGGSQSLYGGGGDMDFLDTDPLSPVVAVAAPFHGAGGGAPTIRETSAGSVALLARDLRNLTLASNGPPRSASVGAVNGSRRNGSGSGVTAAIARTATAKEMAGGSRSDAADSSAGNGAVAADASAEPDVATWGALEGFGSWGMVPAALPERLGEYHQRLRHRGGAEALIGAQQKGSPSSFAAVATAGGKAGPVNATPGGYEGGGVFGEDFSCLSYLAAQLQRPAPAVAQAQQGWQTQGPGPAIPQG